MPDIIVAVPNSESIAESLGKKGASNGITFYNGRTGFGNLVVLTPSDVSSKYYGLAEALALADAIILDTKNPDAIFGEVVAAAELLGKTLLLTPDSDVSKLLGSGVKYKVVDPQRIRDELPSIVPARLQESPKVVLDRAFSVKGVGDVALGVIVSGRVKVHDVLMHSSGREVTVRSLQAQDVDIKEAEAGTRIGINMKGIDSDSIKKGDILASSRVPYADSLNAEITFSRFSKEKALKMRCSLVYAFSVSEAEVDEQPDGSYNISLKRQTPISAGDRFILIGERMPRMFAVGTVKSVMTK